MFQDLKLAFGDGGLITTNIPAAKDTVLRTALQGFLALPLPERMQYSQQQLGMAFDGYSYMGQADSINQYDTDLLHSFVLSNISSGKTFPHTFQEYLKNAFQEQLGYIRALEKEVLNWLGFSELEGFYEDHIKHMVSCNFYPELGSAHQKTKALDRLSFHTDVSLFSVFLFGLESGFAYEKSSGEKVILNAMAEVVLFPGHFMELVTNGRIKALNHGVVLPENTREERFSFAFFSIPRPNASLQLGSFNGTGQTYYEHYLNQF